ncbi:MAG: hypothetical protein AAF639_08595 [Chloroflexota bacterium]
MTSIQLQTGQIVYDPRGHVEAEAKPIAPRPTALANLRLGVLDNTKWNGGQLLRQTVSLLSQETTFASINFYQKESFSKNAAPELIAQIAAENDVVLTAIGD